jgi:Zn finger protein HypA/HybF involved in hydrogenase expression
MIKKTKHDYKCDKCGKTAVYNLQNYWHLYDIEKDGDFKENDSWESDTNEFWCDDCYNHEYN